MPVKAMISTAILEGYVIEEVGFLGHCGGKQEILGCESVRATVA